MTLDQYRQQFGWSIGEMARKANIDYSTLKRALEGESVSARTARSLAQLISEQVGKDVRIHDIEGLQANI